MITCIAIDDEPNALEVIKSLASKVDYLSLKGVFNDPFEAINFLEMESIDVIFLDINMPEVTGFDFLKMTSGKIGIIFTTAYSEYAIKSYDVNAIDYLLKPFDLPRFIQALNKVKALKDMGRSQVDSKKFIFLNTGPSKQRVPIDEIQILESDSNYLLYITIEQNVLTRSSIKDALNQLPSNQFVQINRSIVVALAWIQKVENNHVFIANKTIPIGKTYKEEFFEALKKG